MSLWCLVGFGIGLWFLVLLFTICGLLWCGLIWFDLSVYWITLRWGGFDVVVFGI